MSIPSSPRTRSLTEQSTTLRQELKEWEKTFAAAHGGRTAGRDDIKKDAVIAAKYKTYNRLREHISSSSSSPPLPVLRNQRTKLQSPKKRKRAPLDDIQSPRLPPPAPSQTPRKAQKHDNFTTPLKAHSRHHSKDSPSTLQRLFGLGEDKPSSSPYLFRTSIGPTPQRDGNILGLFDLLSQSGGSVKSVTRNGNNQGNTKDSGEEIPQTPSRHKTSEERNQLELLDVPADYEETSRTRRHSRTPASHGKRFLFSTFLKTPTAFKITPTKQLTNLVPDMADTEPREELLTSGTPSFLQRSQTASAPALTLVNEMGELSPVAVRMPPKLHGRGLSALVQGLRDMAEQENDDDLDALREMEDEEMGGPRPISKSMVLVKNSQANPFISISEAGVADFPVDMEPIVEEDRESQDAAREQKPVKLWKKKGLKRQTRKFIMKPRAKLKSATSEEESKDDDDGQAVAETQKGTLRGLLTGEEQQQEAYCNKDDEYHDTDDEGAEEGSKRKKTASKKAKKDAKPEQEQAKKSAKKKNPNAHANFRALKIKNKNSKGKGRGRFGRRGR